MTTCEFFFCHKPIAAVWVLEAPFDAIHANMPLIHLRICADCAAMVRRVTLAPVVYTLRKAAA